MEATLKDRIEKLIASDRVVLFMKGNKLFPQCGFSAQVVHLLKASNARFTDVNVLSDPEIRQGIKDFSEWPTIPQLYVDGQFVGGCDIVTELHEKGELQTLLAGNEAQTASE